VKFGDGVYVVFTDVSFIGDIPDKVEKLVGGETFPKLLPPPLFSFFRYAEVPQVLRTATY
jgi:hypothetical protein